MESQEKKRQQEFLDMIEDLEPSDHPAASEEEQEPRTKEGFEENEAAERAKQERFAEYELLEQCRNKDKAAARKAFKRLVERYQDQIYTYIRYMVTEESLAFELTRDLFVRVYREIAYLPARTRLSDHLLKLARQQKLKGLRQREKGLAALLPLPLYDWYRQRAKQEEEAVEEVLASEKQDCRDTRRLLIAYIDNSLDAGDASRVENHLADCPDCCQVYDEMLEQADIVQEFGGFQAPANLQPAIEEILDRESVWEGLAAGARTLFAPLPGAGMRQFAAALSLVLILFGSLTVVQQSMIMDLRTRLNTRVRGPEPVEPQQAQKNRFVILTGALVSEALPLELGEHIPADMLSDPERTATIRAAGEITTLTEKCAAFLQTIGAKTTTHPREQRGEFLIQKITAELPIADTDMLTQWFTRLGERDTSEEAQQGETLKITVYLLDRTSDEN